LISFCELQGISKRMLFTLGTFLVHETVLIGHSLFLYAVYEFKWSGQNKIHNDLPDRTLVMECLKRLFVSHFIQFCYILHIHIWRTYLILVVLGKTCSVIFPIVSQQYETLFYWAHRLLHYHPSIYKLVYMEHHRFRATIGIASEFLIP
jgi:hypothetical protein